MSNMTNACVLPKNFGDFRYPSKLDAGSALSGALHDMLQKIIDCRETVPVPQDYKPMTSA
jgi:hypothetical protein